MHYVEAKGLLFNGNRMNTYRGCTHGCIYCDSRSRQYGFQYPFEDIEVKQNAVELLEKTLRGKRKKGMIHTGAMSDPYMHCEERLGITRKCLEIIDRYGFGVTVTTKSARILRDLDLLKSIHAHTKCVVQMSLTTADEALCKVLEPHVSTTKERVEVLRRLQESGIPTVVWILPTLPFLNDSPENLQALLDCCASAGVKGIITFGFFLTLRPGSREYFYRALDQHFPGMKEKYIARYGGRQTLVSDHQPALQILLREFCESHGMMYDSDEVIAYLSAFPEMEYTLNYGI